MELTQLYNMIAGKKYSELTPDQKRILYAVELWKDGMDIELVVAELKSKVKANEPGWELSAGYVDQQLRETFEYWDESEVPSLEEPREEA
jgi:hypothetical protein